MWRTHLFIGGLALFCLGGMGVLLASLFGLSELVPALVGFIGSFILVAVGSPDGSR